jgi:hypothetical protein
VGTHGDRYRRRGRAGCRVAGTRWWRRGAQLGLAATRVLWSRDGTWPQPALMLLCTGFYLAMQRSERRYARFAERLRGLHAH